MDTTDSPKNYFLDFDGVLCYNVGDSSETALRSANDQCPYINLKSPYADYMLNALFEIRPVVATGY